ncbi:small acidic protein 1 [Pyrus ussuriensis x Pyrus communis]|uniref:Small acidic protein 1 n=1 Tax=Pyrus ussuriensis x Pyrus communis TaxID=2448454 RepID=A0A5N5HWL5_9ROSA|nr:small acidic protein 1 [Pyrus ussuriensis x Pyrus communis]
MDKGCLSDETDGDELLQQHGRPGLHHGHRHLINPLKAFRKTLTGESKLANANFFTCFKDDFDDTDIN